MVFFCPAEASAPRSGAGRPAFPLPERGERGCWPPATPAECPFQPTGASLPFRDAQAEGTAVSIWQYRATVQSIGYCIAAALSALHNAP